MAGSLLTASALERTVAREANNRPSQSPTTEVRNHRGRLQFFVDGQPMAIPVFETYVPEEHYFRQFADAGTQVFSFATHPDRGRISRYRKELGVTDSALESR